MHPSSIFLTLTFDQEHLPYDGSVNLRDVQTFLKRLRKNSGRKIRFFAVGEYGDRNNRPHYHLVLFGMGRDDSALIEKAWGRGLIHIGDLTPESADYVVGYIAKGFTKQSIIDRQGALIGRKPEFATMSKRPAIGSGSLEQIAESFVCGNPLSDEIPSEFRIGNKKYPFGRTLHRKLAGVLGCDEPDRIASGRHLRAIEIQLEAAELTSTAWLERDKQRRLNSAQRAEVRHKIRKSTRIL